MIKVKGMRKVEESAGSLRAFADITINEKILIKGCRVVAGQKGLFVSMPQTKGKDEKWYPIVRIEDQDLYQEIQEVVLEAYNGSAKKDSSEIKDDSGEF